MTRRKNATLSGAAAMTHPLPLGHTAEVRAQKMRALRAEAGKQAKADLDAIRERCAPATAFPPSRNGTASAPRRHLLSTPRALTRPPAPTGCARKRRSSGA